MKCPLCGKRGIKQLKGYCCRAHRRLYRKAEIKNVYCSGGCGTVLRRTKSSLAPSGHAYCKRCKRPRGESHYKWQGSYIDKAGYRMILIDGHYVKEHRIVWEQANKACLFDKGTIHHIRFDLPHNKLYNDADNLLLLSDREHGQFHRNLELGRLDIAFRILRECATRQLHHPNEIENYIQAVLDTEQSA